MPLKLLFQFIVQDILSLLRGFLTTPLKFINQNISLTLCVIHGWKALDVRINNMWPWRLFGDFWKAQNFEDSARLKWRLYLNCVIFSLSALPMILQHSPKSPIIWNMFIVTFIWGSVIKLNNNAALLIYFLRLHFKTFAWIFLDCVLYSLLCFKILTFKFPVLNFKKKNVSDS